MNLREYAKPSSIETPAQGALNSAVESKKSLNKQIKELRRKLEVEPLGGNRDGIRLDILRLKDSLNHANRAISDSKKAIEQRANELGVTTRR